ncbi:FtsX-like permease family protein [Xanthomonas theicola]|uniref:ABC transporter permease n=1 Tax=Xanthomonas theicola TaxID=56464 RepID=A0A2S6ZFH6_9XANT|nr:ABC transporter permease [Xanthomonas theicola]PPT91015.1 ABC transporter permease [Xanthomonas theicola]QNH24254.1 FtsX-like permease family protein [Xanthomonas theicola]
MVALARQTLRHEWRRFLPVVVSVGFASLLLLLQTALVLGIFGSASVYVSGSAADLWLGYPGTQSVDQGRPIDPDAAASLYLDPQVLQVEPFVWFDGDWRGPGANGAVSIYVSGIDTRADGLMFARLLSPALRAALREPDTVVVDRAELDKLGVRIGRSARINGHRVRVVGVGRGLRALGGVNVLASLETTRALNTDEAHPDWPTYLVARLRPGADAEAVARGIPGAAVPARIAAWSAADFARRSILFWMFDTGAGAGVLFLGGIVLLVGVAITSQTLLATVLGAAREYATLNALGVSMRALRWVVLEQAAWVGALGLFGASALGAALVALARAHDVPVAFDGSGWALCVVAVMLLTLLSALAALRGLRRADPALLLR